MATPKVILRQLLRGDAPDRPLFLPVVFSLGAKTENVPLPSFLANPTKIVNSLRQIAGHIRSDGLACYFDPYLELEALGAALDWSAGNRPNVLWRSRVAKGEIPAEIRSPDDAAKAGRIPVALDVIRRLKLLQRDGSLLMAGVTGPFTLAARIAGTESDVSLDFRSLNEDALEIAASLTTQLSSAFSDAGANVVFFQENVSLHLDEEVCGILVESIASALNAVRFYEALPVLQLSNGCVSAEELVQIVNQGLNAVVCCPLDLTAGGVPGSVPSKGMNPVSGESMLGASLPSDAFLPNCIGDDDLDRAVDEVLSKLYPVILTTSGDVPAEADTKRLVRISERVRRGAR